jgi:phosphatidylglycerophosphatase A
MPEARRGAAVWIATCGGVGYFPLAPGTAGSAVGLALVAGLGRLPLGRPWLWALLGSLVLGIFIVGVWAARDAEKFFGQTDPRYVVIDEVVGQMLTFLARPDATWKWLLAGFVLFRIFDVVKPFPARRVERLAGGWGIMMDDVAASAYSIVAVLLLGYLLK